MCKQFCQPANVKIRIILNIPNFPFPVYSLPKFRPPPVAVQSPSDPERAVRIQVRLYTTENITIYHAISPFGCRVFSFSWKRIHTEKQAGFRTPATAINLTAAGFQTFFLTLKFARTEKYINFHF
jgi:hypothetical protein